jgi:heme-degrading monooxygenase HmoA
VHKFFGKAADHQALYAKFRKQNYAIATAAGYDEYYLLRADSFNTDDTEELVVKENATTRSLVSAFTKYTNSRLSNRVILNRFIGLIA